MANTAYMEIELGRNGSYDETWAITQGGVPRDLTGHTFELQVKNSAGPEASPAIATATITNGGVNGLLGVQLLGSAFAAVPGDNEVVNLAYDLVATYGGLPHVWVRGPLILSPGVTY